MKKFLLALSGLLGISVLAFVLQYFDDTRWAKQLGEPCDQNSSECPTLFGELYCIESWDGTYCTPACGSDAECPKDWVCEQTSEAHNVLFEDRNGKHLRPGGSPPWVPDQQLRTCRRPSEAVNSPPKRLEP